MKRKNLIEFEAIKIRNIVNSALCALIFQLYETDQSCASDQVVLSVTLPTCDQTHRSAIRIMAAISAENLSERKNEYTKRFDRENRFDSENNTNTDRGNLYNYVMTHIFDALEKRINNQAADSRKQSESRWCGPGCITSNIGMIQAAATAVLDKLYAMLPTSESKTSNHYQKIINVFENICKANDLYLKARTEQLCKRGYLIATSLYALAPSALLELNIIAQDMKTIIAAAPTD